MFEKEYKPQDAALERGILGWLDRTFSDSKINSTIEVILLYLRRWMENFLVVADRPLHILG